MHDLHERAPTPQSITRRRLDISPKKHRKCVQSASCSISVKLTWYLCRRASAPLQVVFVGVAVRERSDLNDKGPEYAVAVSDGTGIVQVCVCLSAVPKHGL